MPQFRAVGIEVKDLFFDRQTVTRELDRATLRVLRVFGFRVRQTARKLLSPVRPYQKNSGKGRRGRPRRLVSKPGEPPVAHDPEGLRKVLYAWDPAARELVIGPVGFGKQVPTVPEILEEGGMTRVFGLQRAQIAARPFMRPSFEKRLPELPELWEDSF